MKNCWDTDPNERPKASKIKKIIENWCNGFLSHQAGENSDEKSKHNIMKFQRADSTSTTYKAVNKPNTKSTFVSRYSINEILQ